jgi:hypothetical protein
VGEAILMISVLALQLADDILVLAAKKHIWARILLYAVSAVSAVLFTGLVYITFKYS